MTKRDSLIMGILFLAWTITVAIVFMFESRLLWLGAGVAGALATGICFSRYMNIIRLERERQKGRKCRMCGQRKLAMALEFGEDEGVCRECLDEVLPLLTKKE